MRLLTAGREVTQTAQTRSTIDQGSWPAKWTAGGSVTVFFFCFSGMEKQGWNGILQVGSLGGW